MAEILGGSFVASGDLSTHQWKLVQFSYPDVYLATSGTLAGLLTDKPQNNEHAAVARAGYIKVILGSSIGANTEFMAGGAGLATIAASGQFCLGQIVSAGDSGDIVRAFLSPYRKSLV